MSALLAKRCVAVQLTSRRPQSKCLLTYLILMGGSIGMQQNLHLVAFAEIVSMHSGHVVGGKKYADSLETAAQDKEPSAWCSFE